MRACQLLILAVAAGYITAAPVPNWLGLATLDGRDAIQLAEECNVIGPGVNVLVFDDGAVQAIDPIQGPAPVLCTIVQRIRMSDTPCAQNASGACDVAFS